jgi:hypothetical protein
LVTVTVVVVVVVRYRGIVLCVACCVLVRVLVQLSTTLSAFVARLNSECPGFFPLDSRRRMSSNTTFAPVRRPHRVTSLRTRTSYLVQYLVLLLVVLLEPKVHREFSNSIVARLVY